MTEVEPLSVRVRENLVWFHQWLRLKAAADINLETLDLNEYTRKVTRELIAVAKATTASRGKIGDRLTVEFGRGQSAAAV
jgi:hypothetical protein